MHMAFEKQTGNFSSILLQVTATFSDVLGFLWT